MRIPKNREDNLTILRESDIAQIADEDQMVCFHTLVTSLLPHSMQFHAESASFVLFTDDRRNTRDRDNRSNYNRDKRDYNREYR